MSSGYYNQIFVIFEDCLGSVKSGAREQKNIADFMPDYNLWYALKFAAPERITIIGDKDISRSKLSEYIDDELRYLSIWLTQITGIYCNYGYSFHGDWKFLYGYPSEEELIDFLRVPGKILFIDRNTKSNKKYVTSKKEIKYMCKEEFITTYNKNPRIYAPDKRGS